MASVSGGQADSHREASTGGFVDWLHCGRMKQHGTTTSIVVAATASYLSSLSPLALLRQAASSLDSDVLRTVCIPAQTLTSSLCTPVASK